MTAKSTAYLRLAQDDDAPSLPEYQRLFIATLGVNGGPEYQRSAATDLRLALRRVGAKMHPGEITEEGGVRWLEAKQGSPRTRKNQRIILGRFTAWLTRRGAIPADPMLNVPHVRIRKKQARMVPRGYEVCALILSLTQKRQFKDRWLVALAAATTQLRRKALRLVEWHEVHERDDPPQIRLPADKMKSKREFVAYLPPELTAAIAAHRRAGSGTGRVFRSVPKPEQFKLDVARADRWLRGLSDQDLAAYGFTPEQRAAGVRARDVHGSFSLHSLRYFGRNWRAGLGWTKEERMISADHASPAMDAVYEDQEEARKHNPDRDRVIAKTAVLPRLLPAKAPCFPPGADSAVANRATCRYSDPAKLGEGPMPDTLSHDGTSKGRSAAKAPGLAVRDRSQGGPLVSRRENEPASQCGRQESNRSPGSCHGDTHHDAALRQPGREPAVSGPTRPRADEAGGVADAERRAAVIETECSRGAPCLPPTALHGRPGSPPELRRQAETAKSGDVTAGETALASVAQPGRAPPGADRPSGPRTPAGVAGSNPALGTSHLHLAAVHPPPPPPTAAAHAGAGAPACPSPRDVLADQRGVVRQRPASLPPPAEAEATGPAPAFSPVPSPGLNPTLTRAGEVGRTESSSGSRDIHESSCAARAQPPGSSPGGHERPVEPARLALLEAAEALIPDVPEPRRSLLIAIVRYLAVALLLAALARAALSLRPSPEPRIAVPDGANP